MDSDFHRPLRRHTRELNVVPILDMMTTLIIFLLQITSFIEYTKITVPPSTTSAVTTVDETPPLAPKVLLVNDGTRNLVLQLKWEGANPGQVQEKLEIPDFESGVDDPKQRVVLSASRKLVERFHKDYPNEKTLQVGLGSGVHYQHLISLMDGIQAAFGNLDVGAIRPEQLANIVLISYQDADAQMANAGGKL